jgi:fructosamine-3-kinase
LIEPRLRQSIERALSSRILEAAHVAGGDINEAFELELEDGRRIFLKTNRSADGAMFPAEARGLAWLSEVSSLRVPSVLAVSSGDPTDPPFLLLEFLNSARPRAGFDEELGRGLASLHRAGAPSFGLDHDNFIGRLPQQNRPHGSWAEFYGSERLLQQLELARAAGRAPSELCRGIERLAARLPDLVGPAEPPARLHGDLWGGNLHVDELGAPCLIDPAVYGGHREVDLAMMRLFGGFGRRVFEAYAEAYPLAPGHEARVQLYQLYPLLVHLNLFGQSYTAQIMHALQRYS